MWGGVSSTELHESDHREAPRREAEALYKNRRCLLVKHTKPEPQQSSETMLGAPLGASLPNRRASRLAVEQQ